MADEQPTPAEQTQRLYEDAEAGTAKALEDLVAQESFGELLAKVAGNAVAVMKLGSDAADLMVSNLRLAGRRDVISTETLLCFGADEGAGALGIEAWADVGVDLAHPSLRGVDDVFTALVSSCAADVFLEA